MSERRFPLLLERYSRHDPKWTGPDSVPWSLVEAHAHQAKRNHDQTLEELAGRGGLAPHELLAVLQNMTWLQMCSVYPTPETKNAAALALINHDGAIRTEARTAAIRECAALARQRAAQWAHADRGAYAYTDAEAGLEGLATELDALAGKP